MNGHKLSIIENVLDEKVRPVLAAHHGDVHVVSYEDHILKIRMSGQCMNCPAAAMETEELIETQLKGAIPELQKVMLVTQMSEEIWQMAESVLKQRHSAKDC